MFSVFKITQQVKSVTCISREAKAVNKRKHCGIFRRVFYRDGEKKEFKTQNQSLIVKSH